MKKSVFALVVLAGLVSARICQATDKARYNVDDSHVALMGYSPVSYIDLGIPQRGSKEFKSTHDGVDYFLTDSDQKEAFDKNPQKYMPQYGGFCAFGMSVNAKFRIDPNKYLVKNGKLYVFLYDVNVDAQKAWLQGNYSELVKKADKNWEVLSKAN